MIRQAMINKELLKVSLRQRMLYLPHTVGVKDISGPTLALIVELGKLGFSLSEEALHAVNALDETGRETLLETVNEVMGTHLNWASLVRGWLVPTGETLADHFVTFITNLLPAEERQQLGGTQLPCGHFIPEGTFPLERYNGCPFCGTPFRTTDFTFVSQGSKLHLLQLWGEQQMEAFFYDLLLSPVPLDATQRDSLKTLLAQLPFLDLNLSLITQKETRMLVADELVNRGRDEDAGRLFATPNDVLRYLWYRHTGHVQLLKPSTLLYINQKNHRHECTTSEGQTNVDEALRRQLRLKYSRAWCRRVATWLNTMAANSVPTDTMLEAMHPKREMWVRFIRALRLTEYARRKGYEPLAKLLDRFYRTDYTVWQGRVDGALVRGDRQTVLQLLGQRPGLFARCLFATMLTFGPDAVVSAFTKVLPQLPVRLLLTLGTQSTLYFDRNQRRLARTLSGMVKQLPPHPLLAHYTDAQLEAMIQAVSRLYLEAMRQHFALPQGVESTATIYIAPQLYTIPVAVGDRQTTVQDASAALQGEHFPVAGDSMRLFLQWGKGLPAQHLDMDLSCLIVTAKDSYVCSYYNLTAPGARHSGDIQHIPDMVGTAEYIELSLPELDAAGAQRVVFTCNAYTAGGLSPNLMVGWMSAEKPMRVSDDTGVAYDPSTVDHLVRITESNLSKGLVFGVLDVRRRDIVWLEMPFDGQTVGNLSPENAETLLRRLQVKPTIGQVLDIKAQTQHLNKVDSPDNAAEVYTLDWARNTANVSRLLLA